MKTAVALLATVLAVSLRSSWAYNKICMNANTHLKRVYIDGVDYTAKLRHRANVQQCDCFSIPANTGTIAVKAASSDYQVNIPGILECQTDDHGNYEDWVCAPSKMVKGRAWYKPGFSAPTKPWKPAGTSACQQTCRHHKLLPCKQTHCIWTPNRSLSVNCIKKKCADGCDRCQQTGPGKCDPGMCKYGDGKDLVHDKPACNRVCKLDVKAWGLKQSGNGYVKLLDMPTGRTDRWGIYKPGVYLALLDMSTCELVKKYFNTWDDEITHANLLKDWKMNNGVVMTNLVAVEVGVGDGTSTYAPWIGVYQLGQGGDGTLAGNDKYTSVSVVLTGVNYGEVTPTDRVEH